MAANRTYTRRVDTIRVLTRTGGGDFSTLANGPLTVGRGDGSSSGIVRRLHPRFPEPTWPAAGQLVKATLTIDEADGNSHADWRGGSPRVSVRRRKDSDSVAGADIEFNVRGRTSRDVSAMVEQMLPPRILKRNGQPGANERYGLFEIRSSDESNANRSVVLTQRMHLSVVIDVRVVPNEATILEVIGAVDGTSSPTIVATDDGRTLEVRFAFAAGPGETCAKVEMELYGAGASDATPGTRIRASGKVAPTAREGQAIYRARLSGMALETEGKWRLRPTSSSGKQGPWTSLDDADAHIRLATIPGAPVNVVVEPTTEAPDISASLPSSHTGTITRMEAEVTLLPSGRVQRIDSDIGASPRRATLVYSGEPLADGQRTSTRVRLTDQDGIVGRWGAPVLTTHRAPAPSTGPVLTPAPGRLLTVRPTFTITASTFDGWRLRLIHATDDSIVLHDSGETTVVDQTSVNVQVPAGKLTYGQPFRAVASVKFDGESTYEAEITPQPYSIAALPTAILSVPEAVNGRVATQTPTFRRTITDAGGGTIVSTMLVVREAATPAGTGAFVTKRVGSPGTDDVTLPTSLDWEQSYDALLWARNDITALLGTTLSGGVSAGATSVTLASTSGMVVGSRMILYSATVGESEERRVETLPGGNVVTFTDPLEHDHLNGETVSIYPLPPLSPWVTFSVLEPPEVDLLSPVHGATVTRPWQTLDWATTGNGGRMQASAVVGLYDADGQQLHAIAIEGATSITTVPALLLEDATTYGWDVTVTDTGGMSTTSSRRTFTTAFTEPEALTVVTPVATDGSVVVSWPASEDPDLHHYEVSWQADDGTWVRLDGGPEAFDDGGDPFTGTSLTHIGARLGVNAYAVSAHNGWRASEPVNATVTLPWYDPTAGTWEAVRADGSVIGLRVMEGSVPTAQMLDAQQAPGGASQALAWGIAARRLPMRVLTIPAEDDPIATTLLLLMADPESGREASPVWIRPAPGYRLPVMWMVLESFTPAPQSGGLMEIAIEWLEVGSPVHAILPPAPEPLPEGVPDIYSDVGELDFGAVEVGS